MSASVSPAIHPRPPPPSSPAHASIEVTGSPSHHPRAQHFINLQHPSTQQLPPRTPERQYSFSSSAKKRPLSRSGLDTSSTSASASSLRRRPPPLSSKSSSAVPTLSTTSATAGASPTTPTRTADHCPPDSPRSWLTRSITSSSVVLSATPALRTAAASLRHSIMLGRALEADDSDHVGSGANTPPHGAATPRPNLQDKRFPQISNFFTQVNYSHLLLPPSTIPSAATASSAVKPLTMAAAPARATEPPGPTSSVPRAGLITAPATPPLSTADAKHNLPRTDVPSAVLESNKLATLQQEQAGAGYPTPPLSSRSSAHRLADMAQTDSRPLSTTAARKSSVASSHRPNPPARLRTQTLTSSVSTTGLAQPNITAEIANPAISNPATPVLAQSSTFSPRRTSSHGSSRSSQKRKRELTEVESKQNTPPQTPRALSTESKPAAPTSNNGGLQIHTAPAISRTSSNTSTNAPVGQIKGQLAVNIVQGRGLRPSTAPYVVCVFQLNEDISDGGAQSDMMDTRHDHLASEDDLARGVAMRRINSDQGRPLAIPGLRSRQSSQTNIAKLNRTANTDPKDDRVTDPTWKHEAIFDVVGDSSELDISIYDRDNDEAFLGQIRFSPNLETFETAHEGWYKLKPREGDTESITGEIRLRIRYRQSDKKAYGPADFEVLKLIGKGTFGQVFQVRKRDNSRIYAMKVLSKKVIIQKKEVQHTIGERNILVRTATTDSPFIVGLKFSFQTPSDLYLVTDYMSGGELFWHLQREGRFLEDRAKFYIAELILALRHLHQHDIVYRDLKPENILLDARGHIALCDFGLSKANLSKGDTTNTFCGTTEYLAPEVLLDEQGYTKMVDFWSLGVLVFEMCCGWSPFYAEDTQQMYKNIAFGKVRFPRDALSTEGRNFVKGLLNRNPNHRLGAKGDADELMAHPFFADVDWAALARKSLVPPFKPKLKSELDTSNFDPEFTNALASGNASSLNARAAALASGINSETPLSPTLQTAFKGFTFVDESTLDRQFSNLTRSPTREEDENGLTRTRSRGDRMSGVEATNDPEDMFTDRMLDD